MSSKSIQSNIQLGSFTFDLLTYKVESSNDSPVDALLHEIKEGAIPTDFPESLLEGDSTIYGHPLTWLVMSTARGEPFNLTGLDDKYYNYNFDRESTLFSGLFDLCEDTGSVGLRYATIAALSNLWTYQWSASGHEISKVKEDRNEEFGENIQRTLDFINNSFEVAIGCETPIREILTNELIELQRSVLSHTHELVRTDEGWVTTYLFPDEWSSERLAKNAIDMFVRLNETEINKGYRGLVLASLVNFVSRLDWQTFESIKQALDSTIKPEIIKTFSESRSNLSLVNDLISQCRYDETGRKYFSSIWNDFCKDKGVTFKEKLVLGIRFSKIQNLLKE